MSGRLQAPEAGSAPGCLTFLRQLEVHAAASARGEAVPHVDRCAACRRRLERTVALSAWLRASMAPELPADLRRQELLEGIYDRVVQGCEAKGSAARLLARTMTGPALPARAEVSVLEPPQEVRELLDAAAPRPPRWLWNRVRAEVLAQRAARRLAGVSRRVRLSAAAAVLIVGVALGLLLPRGRGTPQGPEIVFVRVADLPATDVLPVAVLRRGGPK